MTDLKYIRRMFALAIVFVLIMAAFPRAVFATEVAQTDPTETAP